LAYDSIPVNTQNLMQSLGTLRLGTNITQQRCGSPRSNLE